jgi:uncharacterized protein
MTFEGDPAKNEANIAKHGIDFVDAVRIFEGPTLQRPDDRRSYGETRVVAYGMVDGHEIVVVYTARLGNIRIISARTAHRNERKAYREAYPGYWFGRQD